MKIVIEHVIYYQPIKHTEIYHLIQLITNTSQP